MRVVLLAAVSVDGFIATKDGNSDWVKDDEFFEKTIQEFGCIAVGHNTFKQFEKEIYPIEGVQHLVLAKNAGLNVSYPNVTYVSGPEQATKKAKDVGFKKLLVIGGGQCNGSFAAADLLEQVWLDEHPLKLGKGIKLFGAYEPNIKLKKISTKAYDGFTQIKHKVINEK